MSDLKVRIIEDFNEFLSLEDKWDSLVDSMEYPMPFLTHSWIRIWLECFNETNSIYIITIWDNEKLVGILHLFKTTCRVLKIFNFKCLRSLPKGDCSNIICKLQDLDAILNIVKNHLINNSDLWDQVTLDEIPYDFGTVEKIVENLRCKNTTVFSQPCNGSYYINIQGSFEDYFKGLNKHFTHNRRNLNNRMSREWNVEFKVINTSNTETLNQFYDLEDTGWKGEEGASIRARNLVKYYNNIACTFSENDQFLLTTLYVSDKPVASIYCLLFKETLYTLKSGANYSEPNYKQFSPGQAIWFYLIKYCFEEKIKRLDFTGEFYSYETHWTKTINQKYSILIFNYKKPFVKVSVVLKRIVNLLYFFSKKHVMQ